MQPIWPSIDWSLSISFVYVHSIYVFVPCCLSFYLFQLARSLSLSLSPYCSSSFVSICVSSCVCVCVYLDTIIFFCVFFFQANSGKRCRYHSVTVVKISHWALSLPHCCLLSLSILSIFLPFNCDFFRHI